MAGSCTNSRTEYYFRLSRTLTVDKTPFLFLDVAKINITGEQLKYYYFYYRITIKINSVFDITGNRYFRYNSQVVHAYGRLTKEKEISNELPKCSGGHLIPYNITTNVFHTLGCSDSITTTDTGNTYKFSTTCGGFDTKHKTEIWYQTYTACH